MEGVFGGKFIKTKGISAEAIQYGPITIPKIGDPIDKIINSTIGDIPYEANGVVHIDPAKIQFLGS